MNKNSKANRNRLKKAKQSIICERTRTRSGTTDLSLQTFILNFGYQKRLSQEGKPKVHPQKRG